MWHDIPERWTGDVPSPAKWLSANLTNALIRLEERIMEKLDIQQPFLLLTKEEHQWLRGVDLLELYIWAQQQVADFSNNSAKTMMSKVAAIFNEGKDYLFPKEVYEFWREYKWQPMPELDTLFFEEEEK